MKKKINNDNINLEISEDVISATETTGLIPSLPHNEYELESYKEIDKFMETPISRRKKYNKNQQDS